MKACFFSSPNFLPSVQRPYSLEKQTRKRKACIFRLTFHELCFVNGEGDLIFLPRSSLSIFNYSRWCNSAFMALLLSISCEPLSLLGADIPFFLVLNSSFLLRSWCTADLLTCGCYMNLNRTHDLPEVIRSQEPLQAPDSAALCELGPMTWGPFPGLLFLGESTPSCSCNGKVKLIFNKSHMVF